MKQFLSKYGVKGAIMALSVVAVGAMPALAVADEDATDAVETILTTLKDTLLPILITVLGAAVVFWAIEAGVRRARRHIK